MTESVVRKAALYEQEILENNNVDAMFDLACILTTGAEGVPQDAARAVELYQRAIEEGTHVRAMLNLSNLLFTGVEGVEQDLVRAAELFKHASKEHFKNSIHNETNTSMAPVSSAMQSAEQTFRGNRSLQEPVATRHSRIPKSYDVFISHAGPDRLSMAIPLMRQLQAKGISCYVDATSLQIGDNSADEMTNAMKSAKVAVIILSPEYIARKWTMRELRSFLQREREARRVGISLPLLVPVFYRLTLKECRVFEPAKYRDIFDNEKFYSEERQREFTKEMVQSHLRELSQFAGIENLEGATNDLGDASSHEARRLLAKRVSSRVRRYTEQIFGGDEPGPSPRSVEEGEASMSTGAPPLFEDINTYYRIVRSAIPRTYDPATQTATIVADRHRNAPVFSVGFGTRGRGTFIDEINRHLANQKDSVVTFVRDAILSALISLADDPVLVSNTLNNIVVLYFHETSPSSRPPRICKEGIDLLETSISISKECHKARANMALSLWSTSEGKETKISRAITVLEEAISISALPRYKVLLARILLSPGSGSYRDPARAKEHLEKAMKDDMFAPAMIELAKLLEDDHAEVALNITRAKQLRSFVQSRGHGGESVEEIEELQLVDYHQSREYVEDRLRECKAKQSQVYLLVVGGAGRGKTSLVRSLQGMKFESEYNQTELAGVSKVPFLVGDQQISMEEVNELAYLQDSFAAVASRIPKPEEVSQEQDIEGYSAEEEFPQEISILSTAVDVSGDSGLTNVKINPDEQAKWEVQAKSSEEKLPPVHNDGMHTRAPNDVVSIFGELLKTSPLPTRNDGTIVQCWDLAGQSQYVMAHSLFVKNGNMFLFVINLESCQDTGPRQGEVRELCRWMELVYALLEDPNSVRPVIVGTHRDSWDRDVKDIRDMLMDELVHTLGEAVYDTWVRRSATEDNDEEGGIVFIAIENRTALTDAEGSGMKRLQSIIRHRLIGIVSARQEVPLRWLAFVEQIEKNRGDVLGRKDISNCVDGFPGFSQNEEERYKDALKALRYFSKLGRIVMLETSEEIVLFPRPEVMLEFVRQVTGPGTGALERLRQKDRILLKGKGCLTPEGLETLWCAHDKEHRKIMLDVLCKVDVLMRIPESFKTAAHVGGLIGIPAKLPQTENQLDAKCNQGESELRASVIFVDMFPLGLMSGLVVHAYNRVGGVRIEVGRSGPGGAIVAAKIVLEGAERVLVRFLSQQKQVEWTFFAVDPVGVGHRCLKAFEEFLEERLGCGEVQKKHLFVTSCRQDLGGCGRNWVVEFQIPIAWVQDGANAMLCDQSAECLGCTRLWQFRDLITLEWGGIQSSVSKYEKHGPKRRISKPFDVFISHAGPDKPYIAIPLLRRLEDYGLSCFLDCNSLKAGDNGQEKMIRAMESAKVGVFILSPEFAARPWPMRELRCFLRRKRDAEQAGESPPILIPVFYRLSLSECKRFEPDPYQDVFRAEKFYSKERRGEASLKVVKFKLREVTETTGIENTEQAANGDDRAASYERIELVKRIFKSVKLQWEEQECDKIENDRRRYPQQRHRFQVSVWDLAALATVVALATMVALAIVVALAYKTHIFKGMYGGR